MNIQNAIEYLEESKCNQKQGEAYQERHNEVLDIAIKALEEKYFFENEVSHIHDWFVGNKDCLLDDANVVAKDSFKGINRNGYIDEVDLDFIVEDIVDKIQEEILNVLSTYMGEYDA